MIVISDSYFFIVNYLTKIEVIIEVIGVDNAKDEE